MCDVCRGRAGELVDSWFTAEETRAVGHSAEHACAGLQAEPIILSVLHLRRQGGKTTSTKAWCLAEIFLEHHEDIAFVSSSEDQSAQLFDEHYRASIEADPELAARSEITGHEIYVPNTKSRFEYLSTSHSRVTGGTRTKVVIDEARDVPTRTFMALLPATFARNGWRCPLGHVRTHAGVSDPSAPRVCSSCNTRMEPWFARILVMSSAAVIEDNENDWFAQLVDQLRNTPDRNAHLFETDRIVNPKIAEKTVDMVSRVFGAMPTTRAYVDVEVHNQSRRKGEDFISEGELNAVVDPTMTNADFGDRPCVAFLDTSKTRDLTSLVICQDMPPPDGDPDAALWSYLAAIRIDIWEPQKLAGKIIDERVIFDHLEMYAPMFPLEALRVDTRIMPWAVRLVAKCKAEPWGRNIVDGVTWREAERDASWALLEGRILAGKIALPKNAQLISELRAARSIEMPGGGNSVRETNRRTKHLDIAEGVAACCYLAHLATIKKKRGVKLPGVGASSVRDLLSRVQRPKAGGQRFGPNGF